MHQVDETSSAKKNFGAQLLHNTIIKSSFKSLRWCFRVFFFYHPKTESTPVPQKDQPIVSGDLYSLFSRQTVTHSSQETHNKTGPSYW